jgi:hypothetical protein
MSWLDPESIERLKNIDFKKFISTTIKIPILRNVYPKLIAQELVGVQQMNPPTGKYFYNKLTRTIEQEEFFKEEEFNL